MADHNEIVAFTLQQRGDLAASLPATAKKLRDVGEAADKAKRGVADMGDLGAKAAQKMGGAFGDTYEVVAEILGPLATMGGTVATLAAGAAAAALAVAGLAVATKALTDAGVAAAAELQAMGHEVDGTKLAALNGYTAATTALGVRWKELQVTIGAELAPALTKLATALAVVVDGIDRAYAATTAVREEIQFWTRVIVALVSLGTSELARWMTDYDVAATSAANATQKWADALNNVAAASQKAAAANSEITARQDEAAGAWQQRLADERARAVAARAAARSAALLDATTQPVPVGFHRSEFQQGMQPLMGTMHGTGMPVGGIQGQDPVPVDIKDVDSVAADRLGQALGALRGGMTGLGALAGPWGALIAAAIEILPKIDQVTDDLMQTVLDFPKDFGDAFIRMQENLPGYIAEGVESFAQAIALGPTLVAALHEATPVLIGAILQAVLEAPVIIVEALFESFKQLWESIKNLPAAIAKALTDFGNKAGDALGIHMGREAKAKGEREFFGIRFDRFAMHGGVVTQSGMAMVHKGERIGPSGGRRGGGGGSVTINVGTVVSSNPERFVEQLQSLLGPRGINLSLTPNGSS